MHNKRSMGKSTSETEPRTQRMTWSPFSSLRAVLGAQLMPTNVLSFYLRLTSTHSSLGELMNGSVVPMSVIREQSTREGWLKELQSIHHSRFRWSSQPCAISRHLHRLLEGLHKATLLGPYCNADHLLNFLSTEVLPSTPTCTSHSHSHTQVPTKTQESSVSYSDVYFNAS